MSCTGDLCFCYGYGCGYAVGGREGGREVFGEVHGSRCLLSYLARGLGDFFFGGGNPRSLRTPSSLIGFGGINGDTSLMRDRILFIALGPFSFFLFFFSLFLLERHHHQEAGVWPVNAHFGAIQG